MREQKKNIDFGKARPPLTHSPFERLKRPSAHEEAPAENIEQPSQPQAAANRPFTIERTRKGGYDIQLEKRPSGKVVTVVKRVGGDAEVLLKALKKRLGAGGAVREGEIEIQGDHRAAVETYLKETLK